jgi:outer membrane protein
LKKLFKSIALTTLASGALLSSAAISAAEQKIAVVNFQEVMGKIPQTEAVMVRLEAEFKDQQAVLAKLEKDIKYFQEKKTRDGALMSKKEKEELDAQIASHYQDYQVKGKALQDKAGARRNEETNKIVALVRQAIDGIAAKGKFDLVLDKQATHYSAPATVITEDVIEAVKKLNSSKTTTN